MAISDELTRIQTAKADIKTAIEAKGVTVPSSALIDEYDTYIAQISGGGSSDLRDVLEKDITSLDIPAGTTKIGSYAFIECTSLASVSIPNSVTRIETDAFNSCYSLTSINIPNSVTMIGNGAFHHCTGLTSVTIGNGVTAIGPSAFKNCPSLTEITIPSNVRNISLQVFEDCSGLTSITVEATTPPSLGTNAFDDTNNCPIYVPAASVEAYKAATNWSEYASRIFAMPIVAKFNVTDTTYPTQLIYYDEKWAPDTKNSFSKMVIDGVVQNNVVDTYQFTTTGEHTVNYILSNPTQIGSQCFYDCRNLTSVSIPNGVTSIGSSAFPQCTGLTSINIPNSVTSIGIGAFGYCSGLTNIFVESGNSVYDSRNNCNAIIETATNTLLTGCKNTVIPNTVTTIDSDAFRECTGLTNITIPDSVTTIGTTAFDGCRGLTSVTIGNGVTSIGYGAFEICTALTSVTIPNSVTSIGGGAFNSCSGLTSVTIGNGVTSIGQNAFYNCSGLTSITVEATTPPTLGSNNSFNNTNNCPIYVPAASVETYKTAQYWSTYASRIQAIS